MEGQTAQHSTAWQPTAPPPPSPTPTGRPAHTPGHRGGRRGGRGATNHAWDPGAASRTELRKERRKDFSRRSPSVRHRGCGAESGQEPRPATEGSAASLRRTVGSRLHGFALFFSPDRVEYLHARAINAAALPYNFLFPFHLSSPRTRRTGKHRMRDEVTRKAAERSPQGDRDVTGPGLPLCYPIAQRPRHPTRPHGAQKENGIKVSAEGGETSSGRDPGCSAGAPLGADGGSAGPPRGMHTPLSPVCPPVLSNPYPVSSPPHSLLGPPARFPHDLQGPPPLTQPLPFPPPASAHPVS